MEWIYLSPHLDDIALSCGGLVWEQGQAGAQVQIWTICAGDLPAEPLSEFAQSLHARWQTGREAMMQRRQEDLDSCAIMQAGYRHFPIADCIYRRAPESQAYLYASEEALFGSIDPRESDLPADLGARLAAELPPEAEVVCPLAIGGHVDHRLTRAAAEQSGRALWYYADYPYVLRSANLADELRQAGWSANVFPISASGLSAWQQAVTAHRSQISSFWAHVGQMRAAIQAYAGQMGGVALWRPPAGADFQPPPGL